MGLHDDLQQRARGAALGSLGDALRSPLAQAAIRYWWVAVPVGYVVWRSWKKRSQVGKADPVDVVMDAAPMVTLIATLVMLNQALKPAAGAAPAPATAAAPAPRPRTAPIPPNASIRDADFTPKEG